MRRDSSLPIACSGPLAMFTVGQTIVLGLAGSVYVFGAAFLIGGQAMLNSGGRASTGGEGGQVVRADGADGRPAYFIPNLGGRQSKSLPRGLAAGSTGSRPQANAGLASGTVSQGRDSRSGLSQRGSSRREAAESHGTALKNPICLN